MDIVNPGERGWIVHWLKKARDSKERGSRKMHIPPGVVVAALEELVDNVSVEKVNYALARAKDIVEYLTYE